MPNGRKIKEWALYQKVSVTNSGQVIYPDVTHPLRVKVQSAAGIFGEPGYQPEINITVDGDPWILVNTYDSIDMAKAEITKLGGQVGLDQLKLVRVVDLYNVLYPIA